MLAIKLVSLTLELVLGKVASRSPEKLLILSECEIHDPRFYGERDAPCNRGERQFVAVFADREALIIVTEPSQPALTAMAEATAEGASGGSQVERHLAPLDGRW